MKLHAHPRSCWTHPLVLIGATFALGLVVRSGAVDGAPVDNAVRLLKAVGVDQSPKVAPSVDYGDGLGERVSLLVKFAPTARRASRERKGFAKTCEKHGGYQKYDFGTVLPNVVNFRDVPLSQVPALKNMPGVMRIERDTMVHAYMNDSTPLIRALQSQITGAGLTASGANVRVCIVDTGIDSDNQMYATRIDTAAGRDFVNNDNNPEDDNGHGSHVAGTAVGGTGISRTVCGVSQPMQGIAPNATLIGVKVLDATGNGSFSNVIAGINYCADQTATGGQADIISMSLGGGQFTTACDTDSGAAAANNAVNAGVVVVAASGNDGFGNAMGTPACGSQVISVGATYDANFPNCENSSSSFNWGVCVDNNPTVDSIICFSNQSDLLDVVAPGCDTFSASNAPGGTSFTSKCGTSMATPHVAGLAALILSADPTLTPAQVRQIIRDGAIDLGTTGFDRAFGFGRIDAINSLQLVGPGCTTNADCNDNDPCTTDTCNAGACTFTPISCPAGQTCVGGVCQGQGACCNGLTCSIDNPTNCAASGGSYLGDGSVCGSGTAGNPTVYSNAPGITIPDGGGVGNPATDTITVPDTFSMGDVNVDLDISHTWVGDLTVTVSHLGTTVTVVDRPGVPASSFGCSMDNFVGILLDDEGTGGTIESQCTTNLSSPPNYTPNNSLTAFDGLDAAGVWTITVYDSVSADGGTLNSWSLHIDAQGSNPCSGCTTNAQCDDGVFCNGAETCVAGACQAGTAVNCNDGVACTTDSCNEATASCDNVASNAACDDGLFCNGAETCDAILDCQAGTPVNCNDGVACTTDSCNETTNACDNIPSNAACDDGLFCNGAETCDAILDCQAGTPVNCNDGVACTTDSCNETTNVCDNIASNAACDDGLFCNGAETCDAVLDCQAGTPVNCSDGVACTNDSCNEATNSCDNTANNANCDDGLACNGAETCDAASGCLAGTPVNCNDGVACTTDSCAEPGGTCANTPNAAACDDGLFCNGAETCDALLGCQAGTPVNCNDGVACTIDSCNEGTNACDNAPDNAACGDGVFCNGAETCDATLGCLAGSNPCPGQICDEASGSCVNCVVNADCDDGLFCNGSETCSAGNCVAGTPVNCSDGVACTADSCNEATNACDHVANNANCDNGLFCDGAETCDALLGCQPGTPINCNDGVACTNDSCNEAANACDNIANNANCDNGLFCDGVETCDALLGCQPGTPANCDDGVVCTVDSCNLVTDTCDNAPNHGACDDGLFCNGAETCDAINDCQPGTNPCPGQLCDELTATCVNCLTNADCDDGLFCNGSETCAGGLCQAGVAVNCNDGVACTNDSCNEAANACDNIANNANCDNGLFCDGVETCDAVLDCQAGTPVNCNDGVGCTVDSCNEATNACDNAADNAACDDGLFCNGAETCDAINDCQPGTNPCPGQFCDEPTATCVNCLTHADCDDGLFCNGSETCVGGLCQAGVAVNCNDGVACTNDSCNEAANACDNIANNANCDNGLFCDGVETCDAVLDCQAGTPVNCNDGVACTDDSCNEATNSCDNLVNNVNCPDDGVFCNGVEFCDAVLDCLSTGNPCTTSQTCNEATATCDAAGFVGEGFILSRNPDFSTDDRTFFVNETIYMLLWTDLVDMNNINRARWELKDTFGNKIRQPLTNNFDFSYTASFNLGGLPSNDTTWTWKGEAKDNNGVRFKPTTTITVLSAPACTTDADCADGLTCNGVETCVGGACQPGTPVNCDDGVFCNGVETCDEVLGCVAGTPVNCDDGVLCTADSCNEAAGACDNLPNDALCPDDGVFCNGLEFCAAAIGCSSTGNPCAANQTCNEATATCDAGGGFTGEGFILSRNADFSTDDRTFFRNETIYMLLWTDLVDMNNIRRARWELKDTNGNKIRQPLTNNFDFSYTASFSLGGLPSNDTTWTWKGEAKDNNGVRFKPTVTITVLP